MRKHASFIAAAAIAVGGFGLTGLAQQQGQVQTRETEVEVEVDRDRPVGERTGERVERTGERVGDTAQRTGDRIGDAAQRGVDRTADAIGVREPGIDHSAYPAANISDREANNIRGTLSAATEAALTQGQLRSVAQRLTSSDQERLLTYIDQHEFADLDALIAQFQRDWQQRYNEDFSIDERAAVFPPEQVRIVQGIIPEVHLARERMQAEQRVQPEAHLHGQTPGQPQQQDQLTQQGHQQQQDQLTQQQAQPGLAADREPAQQQPGVAQQDRPHRAGPDTTAQRDPAHTTGVTGDRVDQDQARVATDREQRDAQAVDENQVTVIFPQQQGLQQVAVPLINEGTVLDAWRIDAPLTLDGAKLYSNVQQALTRVHQQREQWPADVNQAYMLVSHHIMLALMDQMDDLDAQPAGHQQGIGDRPGAQQPGAQQPGAQPGVQQPGAQQPGQPARQPGQTNY